MGRGCEVLVLKSSLPIDEYVTLSPLTDRHYRCLSAKLPLQEGTETVVCMLLPIYLSLTG